MAQVLPLHNHHYFKTLMQEMEKNNTNMIIDGTKNLWHVEDMQDYIQQYPSTITKGK